MTQTHEMPVIYLAVLQKDYPSVLTFLAERNRPQRDTNRECAPAVTGDALWGPGRLADLHGVAQPIQKAILTRIARAGVSGESVNYGQLRAAIEESTKKTTGYDNVRGNLAWISKYARRITGTPAGPFTISDMGPGRAKGERYVYLMPAEDATAWLELVERYK